MLIKTLSLKLLKKYQANISPFFEKNGYHCLYNITCSQYAVHCFTNYNEFKAIFLVIIRLLSCNPVNAYLHSRRKEIIYG